MEDGNTRVHALPEKEPTSPYADQKQGFMDKDVVRRVVKQHISAVTACYEKALLTDPTFACSVKTEFIIGRDGTVQRAEITTAKPQNPALERCVEGVLSRMVFPPPEGGGIVVVRYPFIFKPDT